MITTVLTIALLGLGLPYLCSVGALIFGLGRLRRGQNADMPCVSVVVAARNEEEHIGDCLAALTTQDYPPQKIEIIVVDDRSDDRTSQIASKWAEKADRVHLFRVGSDPSPLVGKKRALDVGIRHSRGEIILTTDADCTPKPTWIRGMLSYFEPGVGLVAGYSYTDERGERVPLLQRLRSLERIAVAAVAAGSIGLRRGVTCSGQNLAYRKETFMDVGGFSKIGHLRSGDDDLFLQRIGRFTSWEQRYALSPDTHVRTRAPSGVRQFIQQEKRRASKGFLYSPWLIAILLPTYGFHVFLFVALGLSFIYWSYTYTSWFLLGAKVATEFLLLLTVCSMLRRTDLLALFPMAELLHIPYVIIFGLWGTLGTYRWKE